MLEFCDLNERKIAVTDCTMMDLSNTEKLNHLGL